MVSIIGLALLSIVSLMFVRLDRSLWGSALTPGVVLTLGYTAVVAIYALARPFYDFSEVPWTTYAAIAAFAVACMLCSTAAAAALRWRRREIHSEVSGTGAASRWVVLLSLAMFLPPAVFISLDGGGFWSTDAREAMSSGIIGHTHVLLAFSTVWYAVCTRDRPLVRVVLLFAALGALSLYPVKGWTLIPLTAVAFASSLRSADQASALRRLPMLALAGTLVFFTIYLARANLDEPDGEAVALVLSQVFEHFLFYLTSGLFGLDAALAGLRLHGGPTVLIASLHNLVALMTGDDFLSPISNVFVEGLVSHETGGNVYSFLGSLMAYAGAPAGVVGGLVIVTLSYCFFGAAWRLRSGPLRAAALYATATLAFAWFDYYLSHLTPYEVAALAVMVAAPALLFRRSA